MADKIDFGGEPWKAIPRSTLRDPKLSLKARGALTTLLSHEEGYVRSVIATLMRESSVGRSGAQAAMKELVQAGYAVWERQQEAETGRFRTTYTVYAIRQETDVKPEDSPQTENPSTETPQTENPPVEVEALEVEALEVEPRAIEPSARPRNIIWDALAEIYGQPTTNARPARGRLVADLQEAGADPDDLIEMFERFAGTDVAWAVVTPNAMVKYFGQREALEAQLHKRVPDRGAEIIGQALQEAQRAAT